MSHLIRIGTAGWSIPRAWSELFPSNGTHLQRYAARLSAVEINSSFHRPHRHATYQRWAESVGPDFRFAVKMPKDITHRRRLVDAEMPLQSFAEQIAGLGDKLAVILIQLPPSFAFEPDLAAHFLRLARAMLPGRIVMEPRHPTWFSGAADGFLIQEEIARVAADPAPVPDAAVPGGWRGFTYYRLHGAPHMYRSAYGEEAVSGQARSALQAAQKSETWVVYDNTTAGAATGDALALLGVISLKRRSA